MARVIALYSSLTQQTERVVLEVAGALQSGGHQVALEKLELQEPYPLPLPAPTLARLLKQAVSGRWPAPPVQPLSGPLPEQPDLIILGYQPWFMTPSVPMHAFLKSEQAALLKGRPVIGLLTCRGMYARASGLFREWVEAQGGQVVEQRVWCDQSPEPGNFASLGYMLKHGHEPRGGLMKQLIPPFGPGEAGFIRARQYGESLSARLHTGTLARDGLIHVCR